MKSPLLAISKAVGRQQDFNWGTPSKAFYSLNPPFATHCMNDEHVSFTKPVEALCHPVIMFVVTCLYLVS